MRISTSVLALLAAASFSLASPVAEPVPEAEAAASPVDFAQQAFDANVFMVAAGGTQYGVFIPTDGVLRTADSLTCINIRTGEYGTCNWPVIGQIGVRDGYGPCGFVGTAGWVGTQQGTSTSGFLTIGPPQSLAWVYCL